MTNFNVLKNIGSLFYSLNMILILIYYQFSIKPAIFIIKVVIVQPIKELLRHLLLMIQITFGGFIVCFIIGIISCVISCVIYIISIES